MISSECMMAFVKNQDTAVFEFEVRVMYEVQKALCGYYNDLNKENSVLSSKEPTNMMLLQIQLELGPTAPQLVARISVDPTDIETRVNLDMPRLLLHKSHLNTKIMRNWMNNLENRFYVDCSL